VNVTTSRLLLTTDAIGGVWQYSIDLAQALASRGVHVLLTVLGPVPTAAQRLEASTLAGVKLIETGLPLDWLCDGPGPVRAAATAIADIAHAECADLVQLNAPTLAAYSHFPAPVVAVTHGCVGTWWQAARQQPLAQNYHWHRDAMKQGLAAADRVVAPTASYAATVARYYRMAEAPLVVSNGREPGATPRCAALHDCALTVGRLWDQVKNAAMLDRVAARMAIPFYAAGAVTGPHGETAELDNLHALGQLDSALILSDIPTFRELWNGIAIFVPPDDESAYTDAIDMVIGNPALRQRMGEAARERAIHFTPTRTAEAMLRIYASTLRDHLPRNRAAA
jgi:glycosyltransferase involved in cell wall biosynthesis